MFQYKYHGIFSATVCLTQRFDHGLRVAVFRTSQRALAGLRPTATEAALLQQQGTPFRISNQMLCRTHNRLKGALSPTSRQKLGSGRCRRRSNGRLRDACLPEPRLPVQREPGLVARAVAEALVHGATAGGRHARGSRWQGSWCQLRHLRVFTLALEDHHESAVLSAHCKSRQGDYSEQGD